MLKSVFSWQFFKNMLNECWKNWAKSSFVKSSRHKTLLTFLHMSADQKWPDKMNWYFLLHREDRKPLLHSSTHFGWVVCVLKNHFYQQQKVGDCFSERYRRFSLSQMEEAQMWTAAQISGECGNRGPNKGPYGRSGFFWKAHTVMRS